MGLREVKRERTRRLIADKAFELFGDNGFGRTTVEQIAAAAEVGPSTLYRYFPTKEKLVLEFVDDCLAEAVEWFHAQPPMDLSDGLRAVIERVLEQLETNPDRVRAVFDLAEQNQSVSAHLNELIWRFRNDLADELVRRLPTTPKAATTGDGDGTGSATEAQFVAALSAGIAMNVIETVVRVWVDTPCPSTTSDAATSTDIGNQIDTGSLADADGNTRTGSLADADDHTDPGTGAAKVLARRAMHLLSTGAVPLPGHRQP